jgi:plasmid stabilization system protein ParE
MSTVRITDEAATQVVELDTWWRVHRSSSPALFAREFASAVALLGAAPGVGEVFRRSAVPGVRRLVLRRSKKVIFYIYRTADDAVFILAVWGGQRDGVPTLKPPE